MRNMKVLIPRRGGYGVDEVWGHLRRPDPGFAPTLHHQFHPNQRDASVPTPLLTTPTRDELPPTQVESPRDIGKIMPQQLTIVGT